MKRNTLYTFILALLLTSCLMEQENPLIVGTCTDGIRNQDETDIDCGGRCQQCEVKIPVVAPCATALTKNSVSLDSKIIFFDTESSICTQTSYEYFTISYYRNYVQFDITLSDITPTKDKIYTLKEKIEEDNDAIVTYYDGQWRYVATSGELYVTVVNGNVSIEFCSLALRNLYWGRADVISSGKVVCE